MITLALLIILMLIAYIVREYREGYRVGSDDPMLVTLKKKALILIEGEPLTGLLEPLDRKMFDRISLSEDDEESYTINKKKIYMCLTDQKSGEYYHINHLMYVFLHELSHCICDEEGHTEKFDAIFKELLSEATKRGIYDPNIPMITEYCSHR